MAGWQSTALREARSPLRQNSGLACEEWWRRRTCRYAILPRAPSRADGGLVCGGLGCPAPTAIGPDKWCLSSLQAGDTLVDVPFKLMMTLNTAQEGPLSQVVSEKRMSPTVILALHLLNERLNATSFFEPWLKLLPTTFETPLFWSDEEMALLKVGGPV